MTKNRKVWTITLVSVIGFFLLIFGFSFGRMMLMIKSMSAQGAPVQIISATHAVSRTETPTLTATGNVVAIKGTDLGTEIGGTITAITFNNGQEVKQGDLLIQFDNAAEVASLQDSKAQLKLAKATLRRDQQLLKAGAVALAKIDLDEAQLKQAEAAVATSQDNLDKKSIRAPFDGKIGIRSVSEGQTVPAGFTSLVNLQSINPIYVNFYLPEQDLTKIQSGQTVEARLDSAQGQSFDGKITAINASVEAATHNILVQATFDNPKRESSNEHWFYPGTFAHVGVQLPSKEKVILVPRTAINFSVLGDSVFILTPKLLADGKQLFKNNLPVFIANNKTVVTGGKQGNEVIVSQGLNNNDYVVTAGQQKLNDGDEVSVNGTGPTTNKQAA